MWNGSVRIQCVVAGRPSSTPAAASTNAPVQIDTSRASGLRVASAAASAGSSRPSVTGGPPTMPGTTIVVAVRRIDASWSGSTE